MVHLAEILYGIRRVLGFDVKFDRIHRGNTNFPTGLCCRRSRSVTIHVKVAIDRANRKPYQLGRQAIKIVPFNVIVRSKAVILGRQSLYAVPALSTAQVGILVLPPWYRFLIIAFWSTSVPTEMYFHPLRYKKVRGSPMYILLLGFPMF